MTAHLPEASALLPRDLAGRILLRWTRLLRSHRLLLIIVLAVQALVFSALSAGIRWQPDILQFFSSDSADVQNVHQIVGSGLASHLRLDLHLTTPPADDDFAKLSAATQNLAGALRSSGEFRDVWTGPSQEQLVAGYAHLMSQAPLLLPDLQVLDARLNEDFINRRFAEVRAHLADPDGELLLRNLATDPLQIADTLPKTLRSMSPATATLQGDLLTARDAQHRLHVMMIAEPHSLPSDSTAAQTTLAATHAAIASVAAKTPGLEVWLVGPHRGYVENTHRIKRDVSLVSALGSLAVALAIALYFRGRGGIIAALLCLIPPMIGVGIALGLAGIFHVQLPLLLLGFAGLLCGSTTDYGILIISETRRLFAAGNNAWHPDLPAFAARNVLAPISMSVATSVTGFAALALSDSPGLRALGLFVAAATVCIWLVTFLVLPSLLGQWILAAPQKIPTVRTSALYSRWPTALAAVAFLILTAWLATHALRVQFNTNPRSLDGSSLAAHQEEDAFAEVWGDARNRGIVLASATNPEDALRQNQQLYDYLQDQQHNGLLHSIISSAPILPDQKTLQSRAATWESFWSNNQRREKLQSLLTAAALSNHFKPATFHPYNATLSPETADARLQKSLATLIPSIIITTPSATSLATIVQMNPLDVTHSLRRTTAWAPELRARFPNVSLISGNVLFFDATERSRAQSERLAPLCILAILLPLILFFRGLRNAWLTLACLLIGLLWVLAAAQLFGEGLNLLSLVPILFTLGVAVDYGIYAATDTARRRPIFLCALTTILGSGSLALASHPALRWLGITLAAGITGGYLTSHFLVLPLAFKSPPSRRLLPRIARFALNAVLLLVTLLLCIPPLTELFLHRQKPELAAPLTNMPPATQIAPRAWQVDDNWMRYHPTSTGESGIWEIRLAGDPVHRGQSIARLAAPIDVRIETEMLDQLDRLLPNEFSRYLITRTFAANLTSLPRYIPLEYQQEIYASGTGHRDPYAYLAPTYPRILSYHALHDVSQMLIDNPLIVPSEETSFGCTGLISLPAYSAPVDGHLFLARNFDFEGGESFGRQKSITYVIPPQGQGIPFAHVAWPGLAGCVTGINQEKIALFLNAAATSDLRRVGTPTIFMARDILQHARSLTDAEDIIRNTQTFVSDIIVVADGKTGQARIFEKSPKRFAFYDVTGTGYATVANHLITPTFSNDPVNRARMTDGTTMQRLVRSRQLLEHLYHEVTPDSLAAILRDKNGPNNQPLGLGNRNAIDALIACHSVIIDVTSGTMWVAAWPCAEGEFIPIDTQEMLGDGGSSVTKFSTSTSLRPVPIANMGTADAWSRFLASRQSVKESQDALLAKNPQLALQQADAVILDNPGFYMGHQLKGKALLQLGQRSVAKTEFQQALQENPPYTRQRNAIKELLNQCDVP